MDSDDEIFGIFAQEKEDLRVHTIEDDWEKQYRARHIGALWKQFEEKAMKGMTSSWRLNYKPELEQKPEVRMLESFFKWLVKSRRGWKGQKISIKTMRRYWNYLQRLVKIRSSESFVREETYHMKKFINNLQQTHNASSHVTPKGLATVAVIEDLLYFLWVCDEKAFKHPRIRLQLVFCIILCTFTGFRPGSVVESVAHRGSNDGLKYKDFELFYVRGAGLSLKIRQRLHKGKRNSAENVTYHNMYELPDHREICPVTHFIALALADGALQMPQILDIKLAPYDASCKISLNRDLAEVPLCRALESQSSISPTKIFRYNSLNHLLVDLGKRAGYQEPLTSYCFRRGHGNAIDQEVSAAQRQQIMGHSNERIYQHYISRDIGPDVQAIVLRVPQKKDLMDFLRSMSLRRSLNVPQPKNSELKHSGVRRYTGCSKTEYEQKRKDYRKDLEKIRKEFFENPYVPASSDEIIAQEVVPVDVESSETTHRIRPRPSRFLSSLLKFDSARSAVVNNFYLVKSDASILLTEALWPLMEMAQPEPWYAIYPRVEHNWEHCPQCLRTFNPKLGIWNFNNHCLACYVKDEEKAKEARFWQISYAGQTISTKEAPEPVEIQRPSISNDNRPRYQKCLWRCCPFNFLGKSISQVALHITHHVTHTRSSRCLWHTCKTEFNNPWELSVHMLEHHQMISEYTLEDKARFCHQCSEWCDSSWEWDKHCEKHLSNLTDLFCGNIVRNGVTIVAALCPCCLAKQGRPSDRYRQFPREGWLLRNHIENHLRGVTKGFKCFHPSCEADISDTKGFLGHLTEVHGIYFPLSAEEDETEAMERIEGSEIVTDDEEDVNDVVEP